MRKRTKKTFPGQLDIYANPIPDDENPDFMSEEAFWEQVARDGSLRVGIPTTLPDEDTGTAATVSPDQLPQSDADSPHAPPAGA